MEKDVEDWQWKAKRQEVEEARRIAQEICVLASGLPPKYAGWGERWIKQANSLIVSFDYFLSDGPIHSAYRFAGWITMPECLLNEINKIIAMIKEEEYGAPKHLVG